MSNTNDRLPHRQNCECDACGIINRLKQQLAQSEAIVLLWRSTFQKYQSWKANGGESVSLDCIVSEYEQLAKITPAEALNSVIGPTIELLTELKDRDCDEWARGTHRANCLICRAKEELDQLRKFATDSKA